MANRDLTPYGRGGLAPYARDPFGSFRREMDRLFEDFFATTPETRSFAGPEKEVALRPSIDISETDQGFIICAELPGIAEQDIEVNLRENALTICGEKRSEQQSENGGRRYAERSFGRFERTIPLDAEIDADKVEASYRDGVLTVTLPKNPEVREKSRRIQVRSQGSGKTPGGGETRP